MLIRITDHCTMACSHCLVNATPKNQHMTLATFKQAISLANTLGVRAVQISGGEPTDHPDYALFMDYARANFTGILSVLSNGLYIENKPRADAIFKQHRGVFFQITNDDRYYPKHLSKQTAKRIERRHKNVVFVWRIGNRIYPQGRARKHLNITEDNTNSMGSRCFNLRSFVAHNSVGCVKKAIAELERRGKLCTPSININGSISMGESNQCPETALVTDSIAAITTAIKKSQCNDCGMVGKLPPAHRIAINYLG